jgi:hypothetical protein
MSIKHQLKEMMSFREQEQRVVASVYPSKSSSSLQLLLGYYPHTSCATWATSSNF